MKARWPRTATSLAGGDVIVRINRTDDLSHNEA